MDLIEFLDRMEGKAYSTPELICLYREMTERVAAESEYLQGYRDGWEDGQERFETEVTFDDCPNDTKIMAMRAKQLKRGAYDAKF